MNKRQKIITTAVWFLLTGSICVIIFSGYKLKKSLQIYEAGNQSYEILKEQVRRQESGGESAGEMPSGSVPPLFIDFEELKEINSDTAAWLYCPGTEIDYPVMHAYDYDWYLHHLPDGSDNANGTLFLDPNCTEDFLGGLSIIYGHHMKSGRMFGSLTRYKKQDYFDEHPYMFLYTEKGNYRIDLKYGCVISAGEWRDRAFMYEVNLAALLAYASTKTTFKSAAEYGEDDRFLVLSTCSYEFDDARYIVIGVLRPESGNSAAEEKSGI
ncbi:class B sortase [Lacrimispora sp.]|uniref:class B sortase n=1 Tax=Lacrimispora sp. TaxID=2719234 RepID=UPI00289A8079|nr:class B sortase [Lacrimispora sp.]